MLAWTIGFALLGSLGAVGAGRSGSDRPNPL